MIYDVRWDESMKYVPMSPHNAFGIYESNNLTLKWLLNNSIHQKKNTTLESKVAIAFFCI